LSEKLSTRWSNQPGKIVRTAGQFAWCPTRNETPASVVHKILFIISIIFFTAEVWSLLLLNLEQKAIDVKVNNDIKAMEGNRSQRASQRAKRKSCTAVSYVEPGLRRYDTALVPSSVKCCSS